MLYLVTSAPVDGDATRDGAVAVQPPERAQSEREQYDHQREDYPVNHAPRRPVGSRTAAYPLDDTTS